MHVQLQAYNLVAEYAASLSLPPEFTSSCQGVASRLVFLEARAKRVIPFNRLILSRKNINTVYTANQQRREWRHRDGYV